MSVPPPAPGGTGGGRVLALDYGRRRIGLALSDPGGVLATPHSMVANEAPPDRPPEALLETIREIDPARIVVGVPLEMDGSPGEMARETRRFGRHLAFRTGLSVEEWDERLTTARASRILLESEPRRSRRRRKGRLDQAAAAVILQSYLGADGGGRLLEPLDPEEPDGSEGGRA